MSHTKRFSLIKPTIDTPFHIDFDWWILHDNNWRVYLLSFLCDEHRKLFENSSSDQSNTIDWIDPNTAEVHSVDGLQHTLMSHCAKQPNFITQQMTLVDATFRVFLANGNSPMTPAELSAIVGKSPDIILRTFSGQKVYKGLRPIQT